MIVRHPTALYKSTIPQKAEDGGNITYTISNTEPVRSSQIITRLPPAIELKKLDEPTMSDKERRGHLGEQIFTITKASAAATGTAKKQFEIGQVLEFINNAEAIEINPMRVSASTEIRHDTNILDLSSIGLTDEEITKVTNQAEEKITDLKTQLNVYRKLRKDTEISINENKKSQNETQKAIDAINQLVVDDPSLEDTIERLAATLVSFKEEEIILVDQANDADVKAYGFANDIRQVAQMVR